MQHQGQQELEVGLENCIVSSLASDIQLVQYTILQLHHNAHMLCGTLVVSGLVPTDIL